MPTFIVVLFIMLMQFIWIYIDDLAGKGLGFGVIAQLMFYVSAGIIPLALPLSVLLSSIMSFGNLGESYELIALKAAGVSIWRIFRPMCLIMLLFSLGAFYVSNSLIPQAILKQKSLLYDINQQKPSLMIKERVFYNGIDGISMRIGDKDKNTGELYDILVYDKRNTYTMPVVLMAKRGNLIMSEDDRYLFFNLYDGVRYEEMDRQAGYEKNKTHSILKFSEQQIMFDLMGFSLNRSDENMFKEGYQMLDVKELDEKIDTINYTITSRIQSNDAYFNQYIQFNDSLRTLGERVPVILQQDSVLSFDNPNFSTNKAGKSVVISKALNNARIIKANLDYTNNELISLNKSRTRYNMEWHKKFTLSVACIIMFFIGAPFGAIIRKGGFGMPVVISVLMYLVFHVVSIVGEKMVKTGTATPVIGMWMSIMVLTPIGFFLTYQAANDSGLFDKSSWLKLIRPFKKLIPQKK
jgi:lipopolysaccharide export system permease protein